MLCLTHVLQRKKKTLNLEIREIAFKIQSSSNAILGIKGFMWCILKKQVNGQVPNGIMSYFSKKTCSDPVHYSYVFYYFKYSISCFLEGMQGTIYISMCVIV